MSQESQPRPETGPETPSPEEETGEAPVGFWRRVFGGSAQKEGEPAAGATPEAAVEKKEPSSSKLNRPRKRQRTIFDKAEEQQRKRYARAARLRRERLAGAIGDRVERAIQDRMETGEEKLARAAAAFREMNILLGAIGSNLDDQGRRSERMVSSIERLPDLAEREQETLDAIANTLAGQAHSVEGVPEVVALAREGRRSSQERLAVLRGLKDELELQREQRGQVLEALRASSARFEERMGSLEETIGKSVVQARADATALRQAIERSSERLVEQGREEARREAQQNDRLRAGLQDLSIHLMEQNALASASAAQQEKMIGHWGEAHQELVDMLQFSQAETLGEMHRIQEEVREREERLARRNRLTLIGSAGLLALLGAFFFHHSQASPPSVTAQPKQVYRVEQVASPLRPVAPRLQDGQPVKRAGQALPPKGATSLPAGMPRPGDLPTHDGATRPTRADEAARPSPRIAPKTTAAASQPRSGRSER